MTATRPKPRPGVLDIAAYVPGKSSAPGVAKIFKLSSNETPLGPSPKAIAAFNDEIKTPSQTPVEQWAEQTLPKLKMHADMAQKTGKEVGASDESAAAQVNEEPAAGK